VVILKMTQSTPVFSVRRCRFLNVTAGGVDHYRRLRSVAAVQQCPRVWTGMRGTGEHSINSCLERQHAENALGVAKECGNVRLLIVV
jgi:hypothetical protein